MRSPEDQRQLLAQVVLCVRGDRANSRRLLSNALRLSPTTAGQYVDQLLASGHLAETGIERGRIGRPQRSLSVNPEAGWFAGIEFNAERLWAVRIDFSGALQSQHSLKLPRNIDAGGVLERIAYLVTQLSAETTSPLLGIGIGAPGIVDPDQGIGIDYAFLPGWKNVPIAETLQARFPAPVTLENNLRAIALAERWFGGAQHLTDYLILGPRAGFGVAVVIDGKPHRGTHWAAGEIGRWRWSGPGGTEAVHDRLTAPAAWRRLTGAKEDAPLPSGLRSALSAFAETPGQEWHALAADYALVIGHLQVLLDSQAAFLHGPVTALGEPFCEAIVRQLPAECPPLELHPTILGDDAGALGAASLAMEAWRPEGP